MEDVHSRQNYKYMKPTAYEQWLYKVSNADTTVMEHLIKSGLASGNEATFDLMEESGESTFKDDSFEVAAKYIINKVKANGY
jgi:hypothetical protein